MNFNMEKHIENYSLFLKEDEKSENTVDKYLRDVRYFLKWTDGRQIVKSLVIEYKKILCTNYAPASVNSMLASLNSYFDFIKRSDLKVKNIKIQKKLFLSRDRELTKEEYEKLLKIAKNKKNKRLFYLIQTICATGIRISDDIYCKGRWAEIPID